nr:type IV toxin-antitoxin system AbiEi family antitoxin domain-containing protein [Bacteroidota bacterium]
MFPGSEALTAHDTGNFEIHISSVTRAMMECLEMTPVHFDLEESWLIMEGFLFCLFSSKRPLIEILKPNFLNQESALINQFSGMSAETFTYEMYENVRKRL